MPHRLDVKKNYTLQQHLLRLAKSNLVFEENLEHSLKEITQVSSEAIDCERVSVWTFNDDKSALILRNLFQNSKQLHSRGAELLVALNPRYFEYLQETRLLATHDVTTNYYISELIESYYNPLGIVSMLNVPIHYDGKLHGVICHEQVGNSRVWTAEEEAFGMSLAELIGRTFEIDGRLALQQTLERTNRILSEKLHENQDQQQKMRLAFQLSSLGEMAASIAHEINSPLTTILLRAENLKVELQKVEINATNAINQVDKILSTTERVAKIIKGLKSLSQNTSPENFVKVPLKSVIEETFDFCKDRFKQRGVELKTSPIPNCDLECHPTQMTQMFLNIFNNAIDAVENLKNPWVSLEISEKQDFLIFVITDSGPGVSPEIADKITEAFFTTKPNGKGTGLGLSISRGIIEEHQGSMTLNQESLHTQFIIEIPKIQVDRKSSSEAA